MKIKYFTLLSLIIFLPCTINGQSVNFDEVIVPMDTRPRTFEGFLVQLAWLNKPSKDILDHKNAIAMQEVRNARVGWLQALGVNVSFNQTSNQVFVGEGVGSDLVFYPRVSFGASLNIQPLFSTPGKIKVAKERVKIAGLELDEEKLRLRSETVQRYKAYELAKEILKVRTNMEADADANFKVLRELFKNNEADYKDYNQAYNNYYQAQERRLEALTDIEIARAKVEEYIGIDLELAEKLYNRN